MGTGFTLGIGVFLAWALTREVDPANNYSAFIAAALSLLHYLFTGESQFLLIAWVLSLLRAINGISGKALTLLDIFVAFGFTIFISFRYENSLFLLVFAITAIGLYKLRRRKNPALVVGVISVLLYFIQLIFLDYFSFARLNLLNPLVLLVIICSIIFALVSKFMDIEKAVDDKNNKADPKKILFGQLLYSATIILLIFFSTITYSNLMIQLAVISGCLLNFVGAKANSLFKQH